MYIAECNNCNKAYLDHNPSVNSINFPDNFPISGELVLILEEEGNLETAHWACPECKTDEYLQDYELPDTPKITEAILGIDWRMLKDQKMQLIFVIENGEISNKKRNALEGILHLIDAIQDAAIDDGITTKAQAFGSDEEAAADPILQKAWAEFEMTFCDGEEPMPHCTVIAKWLRNNYFPQGKIMGYDHDENPEATIGEQEGGHNFLMLPHGSIIDFWYKAMYDPEFPLLVTPDDHTEYYGDPNQWDEIPD